MKIRHLAPAAILLASACTKKVETPHVRVLVSKDFLRPEVVQRFERNNNLIVDFDYVQSNEELRAKLQASTEKDGRPYDLAVPSDYMVENLARAKLLTSLDRKSLGFLDHLDPTFMHPYFDRDLAYSVPYSWGSVGVAVNTNEIAKDKLAKVSWKDLLESPNYKGKLTLLDDPRETLSIAFLVLGKNWTTATEADVNTGFAWLKKNRGNIRAFTNNPQLLMQRQQCSVCQDLSGNAHLVATGEPQMKYVIPKEGATLRVQNLVIPKNAANPKLAYAFINELMAVESATRFTNSSFFATTNLAAKEAAYPQVKNNPGLFPEKKVFDKLSYVVDRPDLNKAIERHWSELKSK